MSHLNQLAANGSIEEQAPVVAHVQAEIHAPPARVWALLVGASSWPKWQKGIEAVEPSRTLTPGASFNWTTGGTTIHAQVQLFEAEHRLSWTGRAYTAKAVHVWTLIALTPDRTLVKADESMDGPFMEKFFSSKQLREADFQWVNALKIQAETPR